MKEVYFAKSYNDQGFAVIPLKAQTKQPVHKNWQKTKVDDFSEIDFNASKNIDVVLGAASGGLTDVDIDTPDALEIAHQFLPETECRIGHYWKDVELIKNSFSLSDPDLSESPSVNDNNPANELAT